MARNTTVLKALIGPLLIFLVGVVLIVCTLPVFPHTRQELVQVPKSDAIVQDAFNIDQLENKTVPFQISIGQTLGIYATCNGNISFSIVNFTSPDDEIQPDQPDIVYFSQNDAETINMTWSPQSRVPDPGKYYLVFLARNALPDSPVRVYANVTKTWTEYQHKEVLAEDRVSLLDQNYGYVGSAMVILGIAAIRIAVVRKRRSRR